MAGCTGPSRGTWQGGKEAERSIDGLTTASCSAPGSNTHGTDTSSRYAATAPMAKITYVGIKNRITDRIRGRITGGVKGGVKDWVKDRTNRRVKDGSRTGSTSGTGG